jgi:hypothetical protein
LISLLHSPPSGLPAQAYYEEPTPPPAAKRVPFASSQPSPAATFTAPPAAASTSTANSNGSRQNANVTRFNRVPFSGGLNTRPVASQPHEVAPVPEPIAATSITPPMHQQHVYQAPPQQQQPLRQHFQPSVAPPPAAASYTPPPAAIIRPPPQADPFDNPSRAPPSGGGMFMGMSDPDMIPYVFGATFPMTFVPKSPTVLFAHCLFDLCIDVICVVR